MVKNNKVRTQFYLPIELNKQLEEYLKKQHWNKSVGIEIILKEYFKTHK